MSWRAPIGIVSREEKTGDEDPFFLTLFGQGLRYGCFAYARGTVEPAHFRGRERVLIGLTFPSPIHQTLLYRFACAEVNLSRGETAVRIMTSTGTVYRAVEFKEKSYRTSFPDMNTDAGHDRRTIALVINVNIAPIVVDLIPTMVHIAGTIFSRRYTSGGRM